MSTRHLQAPAWSIDQWFNTPTPLSLQSLRGKVIVLEAFQMLCPGCVSHGLPQMQRVQETFSPLQLAVIGLHSVFEHHQAMTPTALAAFLHEYRITYPVGVDRPGEGRSIPQTMQAYDMQGTPTTILIDAQGQLRYQHLGQISDMLLSAQITTLILQAHADAGPEDREASASKAAACDGDACPVPTVG